MSRACARRWFALEKAKSKGALLQEACHTWCGQGGESLGAEVLPVGVSLHSKPSFSAFGALEEPLLCGALCLQDAYLSARASSTARAGTRLGLWRFPSPNPHRYMTRQEGVGLWLWGLRQRSPSPPQLSGKFRLSWCSPDAYMQYCRDTAEDCRLAVGTAHES